MSPPNVLTIAAINEYNVMSGDDLVEFVDQKLFPFLQNFTNSATRTDSLEYKIGEIFGELHNTTRSQQSAALNEKYLNKKW